MDIVKQCEIAATGTNLTYYDGMISASTRFSLSPLGRDYKDMRNDIVHEGILSVPTSRGDPSCSAQKSLPTPSIGLIPTSPRFCPSARTRLVGWNKTSLVASLRSLYRLISQFSNASSSIDAAANQA